MVAGEQLSERRAVCVTTSVKRRGQGMCETAQDRRATPKPRSRWGDGPHQPVARVTKEGVADSSRLEYVKLREDGRRPSGVTRVGRDVLAWVMAFVLDPTVRGGL